MRKLLLLLPFLLASCTDLQTAISNSIAPPYVPQSIKIFDQVAYNADVTLCAAAGANWKPEFSFGSAISKTVDGATSNTSLIPISPLVPAYGAAGGALSAASDGLDIMSRQHANVFRNCLREATRQDHSAIVADPRD